MRSSTQTKREARHVDVVAVIPIYEKTMTPDYKMILKEASTTDPGASDGVKTQVASIKGQAVEFRSDLTPSTGALSSALLLDIEFAVLNKSRAIDILNEYSLSSLSSCWASSRYAHCSHTEAGCLLIPHSQRKNMLTTR